MVPFSRKKTKQLTRAKFVFYFGLEQRFEQGAGSLAEGAREPEIAYASGGYGPSLSPPTQQATRENRTPLTRIYSGRRRNKKAQQTKDITSH
jgi:hypothetical protein